MQIYRTPKEIQEKNELELKKNLLLIVEPAQFKKFHRLLPVEFNKLFRKSLEIL